MARIKKNKVEEINEEKIEDVVTTIEETVEPEVEEEKVIEPAEEIKEPEVEEEKKVVAKKPEKKTAKSSTLADFLY